LGFPDIQQGIAFLLNIKHLANNAIEVGTPSCFAQGWFISIGDLASSLFICAIACHTFLGVVKNYRLPSTVFYGIIAALWFFVYFLAALGPLMHREDFYVRASAWVRPDLSSPPSQRQPTNTITVLDQRFLPTGTFVAPLLLDLRLHVLHRPHLHFHLHLPWPFQ
jgi:hypothetical protein